MDLLEFNLIKKICWKLSGTRLQAINTVKVFSANKALGKEVIMTIIPGWRNILIHQYSLRIPKHIWAMGKFLISSEYCSSVIQTLKFEAKWNEGGRRRIRNSHCYSRADNLFFKTNTFLNGLHFHKNYGYYFVSSSTVLFS